MSFFPHLFRPALLVALAAALPQHTINLHKASEVVMDSNGAMKAAPSLVRRQDDTASVVPEDLEEWPKLAEALLAERVVGESEGKTKSKGADLYVLTGNNICNGGGGLWKRYELNAVTPGRYDYCASACDSKGECVGFDVGRTGCNMYTQKAVAVGTWPSVRFKNAGPFAGEGAHDAFPQTPFALTAGNTKFGKDEMFKCYRKTFYKPADSYYWLIGGHTCSGGGLWKRYKMTPGNYASCANACNQRDECIGFDAGTWAVSDDTTQVYQENFQTKLLTTPGCFMYTQKPVHGTWPGVQAITSEDGEGDHDAYPATPHDLAVGYRARFEVGNQTKCYGKTHFVNLAQYYMQLGQTLCSGGGRWKHYKKSGGTLDACKSTCDSKDECVGLDFVKGGDCRLYTHVAIPPTSWEGVTFDGSGPFAGEKDHDKFPPTPFSLTAEKGKPSHTKHCLAKTHFETPDQVLGEANTR